MFYYFQLKDIITEKVRIEVAADLKDVVGRTLKCLVCLRAPMRPPAAFQRCCQSIVGCMECLEALYKHNMLMCCPKCRAPRGCSNMCDIHGIDELLRGLSYLADDSDSLPDIN